ncbi:hypothetical protein Niako_4207 [Niastella koreensis GR20-10]|uniref:Uncharacterized protein n=1 Tax=Niastella koreensis (strain DSM 17620 / KACC 11465 / NBRC 106392 / GR20-10) TaxID=700598 RepID=G8TEP4_NIAKG|nr:hypothetical protein [Niastella koreensis]AEW00480.1 hypothetical protein Niako_4207 [Niastella koreensis GR20-10]
MKQATLLSLMVFRLFGCKNLTNTTQPIPTPSANSPSSEIKTSGNHMIKAKCEYGVWTK